VSALLVTAGVVVFFLWAVLGHSTPQERQRTVDQSCSPQVKFVRYPDGYHPAVCNPTGETWRR
jgi:hypothetical protein